MERTDVLEGKTIIVTGAGRGIGRGIALLAGRYGANVVVNDAGVGPAGEGTDEGPAHEVVDEITAAGGAAVAAVASVAEPDSARAIVDVALSAFGRLDSVVNNAGILRDSIFHKMPVEDFDQVVKVHLYGSFYISRAAAETFRAQGYGTYVHMTSTSALIGNFGQANYSAAKLGIVGLSKSIALDMGRFGIRSNCVAPLAWTRLVGTIPEDTTPEQQRRVAAMRTMEPGSIAPLVLFLASDLSEGVTGQVFGVRKNELMVYGDTVPVRTVHRESGWTIERIQSHFAPAVVSSLPRLQRSPELFSWDPI
jgi:NAD(P)-dependent dehydrogenase (short-subunit alcohol dehydrogenase family)